MATIGTWTAEGLTVGADLANNTIITGSGTGVNPVVIKTGTGTMAGTSTAAEVLHGTKSIKATAVASADISYLLFTLASPLAACGVRFYFYIPAAPAVELSILTLYAAGNQVQIVLRTDGRFRFNNAIGTTLYNTLATTGQVTFPATFALDVALQPGATTTEGRAKFQLFKGKALNATASDVMAEITTGDFRARPVESIRVGKIGAQAVGDGWSVVMDTGEWRDTYALVGPVGAAANTDPIVSAGPDQPDVEPWGSDVALVGTYTDAEGGTVTQTWAQTSGTPTVTLAGTGATRTFAPPPTIAGATLGFTYSVTDSGGATGTDTTTVTVLPVTERAVIGGVEVPMRVLTATATATTAAVQALKADLAQAATRPVRIGIAGDSTAANGGAEPFTVAVFPLLIKQFQAAYPSGLGTEHAMVVSDTATFPAVSTANGIQSYNGGQSGGRMDTMLDTAERDRMIAVGLDALFVNAGSNDSKSAIPTATYKANAQNVADYFTSRGVPVFFVHQYERMDLTGASLGLFTTYGQALAEVAATNPSMIAVINTEQEWRDRGVFNGGTDPNDYVRPDLVHLYNPGHAFFAGLIGSKLGIAGVTVPGGVEASQPPQVAWPSGVYTKSITAGGNTPAQVAKITDLGTARGKPITAIRDFVAPDGRQGYNEQHDGWVSVPNTPLINVGMPNNTKVNAATGVAYTWADHANGVEGTLVDIDTFAARMIARGYDTRFVFSPYWEANQAVGVHLWSWGSGTTAAVASWCSAYGHAVNRMKTAAPNAQIAWGMSNGLIGAGPLPETAWPGAVTGYTTGAAIPAAAGLDTRTGTHDALTVADLIDYIELNQYDDQGGLYDIIGTDLTRTDAQNDPLRQEGATRVRLGNNFGTNPQRGLDFWIGFVQQVNLDRAARGITRRLRIGWGEWSVASTHTQPFKGTLAGPHGGGDNPFFITEMEAAFQRLATLGLMGYECIYNTIVTGGGRGDFQLYPEGAGVGTGGTYFTRARAAYFAAKHGTV